MNNIRRKAIGKIQEQLDELRSTLQDVLDEEQECFDNIPENLWGSERYEKADEALENLTCAMESIEEAVDYLTEATE